MSGITDCFVSVYKEGLQELPRKVTPRESQILFDGVGRPWPNSSIAVDLADALNNAPDGVTLVIPIVGSNYD
jgi:hypothetical protein